MPAQPGGTGKDPSSAQADREGSQFGPGRQRRIPAQPRGTGKTFVPSRRGCVPVQAGTRSQRLPHWVPPVQLPGGAELGWVPGGLPHSWGATACGADPELLAAGSWHRAPIQRLPSPTSLLLPKTSPRLVPKMCQTPAGLEDAVPSYGQGLSPGVMPSGAGEVA